MTQLRTTQLAATGAVDSDLSTYVAGQGWGPRHPAALALPTRADVHLAMAFQSSSISYAGQTFVKLVMSTELSDDSNCYDPSTYLYTVPTTGVYVTTGSFRLADGVAAGLNFSFGIGPTTTDGGWMHWDTTDTVSLGPGTRRKTCFYQYVNTYTAGDQLRAVAYFDQASATSLSGLTITYRQLTKN